MPVDMMEALKSLLMNEGGAEIGQSARGQRKAGGAKPGTREEAQELVQGGGGGTMPVGGDGDKFLVNRMNNGGSKWDKTSGQPVAPPGGKVFYRGEPGDPEYKSPTSDALSAVQSEGSAPTNANVNRAAEAQAADARFQASLGKAPNVKTDPIDPSLIDHPSDFEEKPIADVVKQMGIGGPTGSDVNDAATSGVQGLLAAIHKLLNPTVRKQMSSAPAK